MSASTSAGSGESRCPLPLGTPVRAAVLFILERSHPGPARGDVNVIERGSSGGRQLWPTWPQRHQEDRCDPCQDRATRQLQSSLRHHPRSRNCVRLCLSATCVDDSEPDPHDAGWRAATGYQPRPPAARCLAANRRTPCCRQPPGQAARGSVDANMSVVSTYRPRRLGRVRPGLALSLVPRGPSPFSSTPHKRPHRPDHRRPSLSPYRRHLPGSPYLLTYTPVVDSVAGQPAAEDEGVLL